MWAVSTGFMWLKVLVALLTRQVPDVDGGQCPVALTPTLSSCGTLQGPAPHCRISLEVLTWGPCPALWAVELLLVARACEGSECPLEN